MNDEKQSKILPPSPPEDSSLPPAPLPAVPEDQRMVAAPEKSPLAAAILAFFPFGLGHLYLGQYSRALSFFIAFWVPIVVLDVPLLGLFFYFFGIFDAFRQAQLINLRTGDGVGSPASPYKGGIAAGVFLVVLGAYLLLRDVIDLSFVRAFFHRWWPAALVIVGIWLIVGAFREMKAEEAKDEEIGF